MRIWAEAPPNQRRFLDPVRRALRRIARDRRVGRREVNVVIVGDQDIRRLNRRFLKHDATTDVLAFSGDGSLLGEIAVSADAARRQARERGVPYVHEVMLLAVHGLLHLVGFDDETRNAWKEMRTAEFETMVRVL